MVLFCKIHDLGVHCASLVQLGCHGAPERGIVQSPLFSLLFATKNVHDKPNAFEGSKMMCEVFFLLVPFRS